MEQRHAEIFVYLDVVYTAFLYEHVHNYLALSSYREMVWKKFSFIALNISAYQRMYQSVFGILGHC